MARNIDFSKPLTADEAEYVSHRPWLLQDAERQGIEVQYESDNFETEDADDDTTLWDDDDQTGNSDDAEEEEPEEDDTEEGSEDEELEDEEDEEVEETDGYETLDFKELQSLAKNRGVSASGTAAQIRTRLREADDESEDA
jgi:hypothetical protein